MKILITAQKGGVGKSTLAVSLAASWAEQGVCLLDLDPQATASQWVQQQPRPGLQAMHTQAMAQRDANVAVLQTKQALRAAERAAPLVVADLTWGRFLPHALLLEFDAVVVPLSPSAFDLQSTMSFLSDCAMVFNSMEAAAPKLVVVPYRVHTQQGAHSVAEQLVLPMQFDLTPPVAFDIQLIEHAGLPPYLNELPHSPAGLGLQKVAAQLQQVLAQRQALRADGGFAAVKNLRDSRSRLNSQLTLLDQFMLNKQANLTRSAHLAHERMLAATVVNTA
jgi:MinD-like ATPase involved in chromosome partitioning or flagellar assembly